MAVRPMRVIGLAGWSGAGKTTLLRRLIPMLTAQGLQVSTLKHAHHNFDVDQPGKDSWEHRQAGAREVLVASSVRWALMHELRGAAEPALAVGVLGQYRRAARSSPRPSTRLRRFSAIGRAGANS